MDTEKFYSKLGAGYQPGVLTTVVLAAEELKRQGKKIIGLTGGMYDEESFPWREVKEIFDEATEADWRVMLQYGGTRGYQPLREELAKWMKGHGITVDPFKELMITTGSQEALDLMARIFLDKDDVIIVGSPTYLSALTAFQTSSPDIREAKLDKDGMIPEELEKVVKQVQSEGKMVKFVYIIPSFQNPMSSMLTMERRKKIIELANKYDFLILEDNPYGYISFEGPMPTPLKGLDTEGRVIYTSTFSKIVSPGMRIGWLAANPEFIMKMAEAKSSTIISNALPSQYAAAKLFERGDVDKQIEKMKKVYIKKRDVMLEAMDTYFPKEAKWNSPKGGLFLWVELPESVNATELLMEAVKRGVAYIPGSNFYTTPTHNHIRLNYSHPSIDDIVEGIKILGGLLKEQM
ncbi:MAG: PLP-dependent aminotransferase family protein [Candidatus Bathyarchaeota archaeon]|nr:PLP-dependent aminotransferase family protein [Candidatus Bathyarchaeota archaeon]